DLERDSSLAVDEPAAPQAAAVDGHGDNWQSERAVQSGETRSQLWGVADTDPRPFRIDDHRPPGCNRLRPFRDEGPNGLCAGRTLDWNDAIAASHPAEERDFGELLLDDDDRQVGKPHHLQRFEHRLVLDRDEVRTLRDDSLEASVDAEYVAREPVMELDPTKHHRVCRPAAEQAPGDSGKHPQDR